MTTQQNGYYGRLMLDLMGFSLTEGEREQLQNPHVGGVILFARNVESLEQICTLVSQIREASAQVISAFETVSRHFRRCKNSATWWLRIQLQD